MTALLLGLLLALAPAAPAQGTTLRGEASWVRASLGSAYLAARLPLGTSVPVCGPRACTTGIDMDWGPNRKRHPERIVDLSRRRFARICGDPVALGVCDVTLTILGAIGLPETDAE